MKNNQDKSPCINLYNILLFIFIVSFLGACSTEKNETSYIQFNNPANTFKQKAQSRMARAAQASAIDSLVVSIKTLNDKTIRSVEAFDKEASIKLTVPSKIPLIVTATAFADSKAIFSGEVTIEPIRAGKVSNLTLLLYDLTQDTDSTPVEVSINSTPLLGKSQGASFSRNDDFVLFLSDNDNLVNADDNESTDVFIRNFSSIDAANTVKNLHTNSLGVVADQGNVTEVDISADGVYAVFASTATNLVPNDSNDASDIFLKNTITGDIQLINQSTNSTIEKNLNSYNPQISDNGNIITFYSEANINGVSNAIFVYNRINKSITSLSLNIPSKNYSLSGDGNFIVYQSKDETKQGLFIQEISLSDIFSSSLFNVNDSSNNLFVNDLPKPLALQTQNEKPISRDIIGGESETITLSAADFTFSMSQDGQYTAFIPSINIPRINNDDLLKDQIYLYNRNTKNILHLSKTRTNKAFSGVLTQDTKPALSNDGQYILFSYDNRIYIRNIKYNNLLELREGRDPFINTKGDKIGYVLDNRLYTIDNPLYVAETTGFQKPIAPTNLVISEENVVLLSWDSIPNASFYRIYASDKPNIIDQINSSSTSISIIETAENSAIVRNNFIFNDAPNNNSLQYFVVFAVNENGEGAASEEVESIITDTSAGNEGTETSPIILDFNQTSSKGFYDGFVGAGKSYYSITFQAPAETEITKVLYLGYASSPGLVVTATGTNGVNIDCSGEIFCVIKNITGTSDITFIVDGSATQTDDQFTIQEDNVQIIAAKNDMATFTLEPSSPFVLINNLSQLYKYRLQDTSLQQPFYGNYFIESFYDILNIQTIIEDYFCEISIQSTESRNDCLVRSNFNSEILLNFSSLQDETGLIESRPFSLNPIPTQVVQRPINPSNPNKFILKKQEVVQFTNLDLNKNYYLSLSVPAINTLIDIKYQVAAGLPQSYNRFCSGRLNNRTNDLDSCAFTPTPAGTATVKLDYLNALPTDTNIIIEIFELDNATIQYDVVTPAETEITNRLMFLKLTNASQFDSNSWLSISVKQTVQFLADQGLTATIKTYDSLERGPQCVANMQSSMQTPASPATCELKYSSFHLIALEFPANMISSSDLYTAFDLGVSPIMPESITLDATATPYSIVPITYFEGDFGGVSSRYIDTLIQATNSFNTLNISAYRNEWRDQTCTSVNVGSSVICITDSLFRGSLNFKVVNETTFSDNSDISISTPVINPIEFKTPISNQISNQEYVIYKFENLDFVEGLLVSVTNTETASIIPFTVVPNIGAKALCSNFENFNPPTGTSCSPDFSVTDSFTTSSGYIIIDTSQYVEGVAFTVNLTFPAPK